jgi:hypothetical protein
MQHSRNRECDNERGGTVITFIPLLVFGALAILLVVMCRRTRSASSNDHSTAYCGDSSTPMMWSDVNSDSSCHSTDTADCSAGDTSCDGGGGGSD